MTLEIGTKLGRYEITSKLGAGGMGEVYLAHDTKLDRKVALKILPPELEASHDRMRRFVQEAKAASALNHPNILTIYEIDETESGPFIATEFIDGETLRERMRTASMTPAQVLDLVTQIASALVAAHEIGIVHRDIKPENVMVRRDGFVKVLDFGLAKLIQPRSAAIDTQAATKLLIQTEPGRVMGTVAYMSPEQVRGDELDARTDIWSLGATIYEMVAGRAPFSGATSSHLGVSILESEPPPLTTFAPQVPAELQRIVGKALTKDRNERYQTARDLMIDLKNLRRDVEMQRKLEPSAVSSPQSRIPDDPGAEYIIATIKRHPVAMLVVLALALGVIGTAAYKFRVQTVPSAPSQPIKISQLTTIGTVFRASISPDGKYIVYAVDDGEQQSLWARQVAATNSIQLVPALLGQYLGITFTPDGNYVDYVLWERGKNTVSLYQVSAFGGAPRKLLEDVHTPISFSPDGKRFAFLRASTTSEYALMIANADGSGEQKLAARKLPDFYFLQGGPAWSPDGKIIVCPAGSFTGGFHVNIIEVSADSGHEKSITSHRWFWVGPPKWLNTGERLMITAKDRLNGPEQIWELSYPSGEAKQLTNDLNDYRSLTLSADARVLTAVQSVQISSTWTAPGAGTVEAKKIAGGYYESLSWTPENRIVYSSGESGNLDIWIMDADGNNHKQLTFDSQTDYQPVVSPDGGYVVFVSDRAGSFNVWRMNLDGSVAKQLTNTGGVESPNFSPDGKWVLYTDFGHGQLGLWRVSSDGGNGVQITDKSAWSPVVSPDGKLIACYYAADDAGAVKLAIIPFEGGQPVKMFDIISETVRWAADGRSLTYVVDRGGASNIWKQPLDGGPATQLTDFKTDRIFRFDWSRNAKQLAFIRGTVSSDVVLINRIQ